MNKRNPALPACIILGLIVVTAGLAIRIWLWSHPFHTLVSFLLIDDGFYYFKIAQNIVAGDGSTFDGVNATNGYHPLWILINIATFAVIDAKTEAVRAVLLIAIILDVAAGLVLACLAFQLLKDSIYSLIIGLLWFLNYRIFLNTQNGMETALALFAINLFFLATYFFLERDTRLRRGFFGVAAGLTILARTDNVVLIALAVLVLLFKYRRAKIFVIPSIVAGLLTAPWFLWNYVTFQTILQSSGSAITGRIILELAEEYGTPIPYQVLSVLMFQTWFDVIKRIYISTGLPFGLKTGAPLSIAWIVIAIAIIVVRKGPSLFNLYDRLRQSHVFGISILIVLWPFTFVIVHTAGRLYFRPHYHFSIAPNILLIVGLLTWLLVKAGKTGKFWATLLIPLCLFSLLQYSHGDLSIRADRHAIKMQAVDMLNEHADTCRIVGSFNAGQLGFFYNEGTLINLDGVVNNAANRAIWNGQLGDYARSQGICVLADVETERGSLLRVAEWGDLSPDVAGSDIVWRVRQQDSSRPYYTIYDVVWNTQ